MEESSDSENDGESERIMEDNGSGEIVPKKGPWKVIEVEQTHEENSTNKTSNVSLYFKLREKMCKLRWIELGLGWYNM